MLYLIAWGIDKLIDGVIHDAMDVGLHLIPAGSAQARTRAGLDSMPPPRHAATVVDWGLVTSIAMSGAQAQSMIDLDDLR